MSPSPNMATSSFARNVSTFCGLSEHGMPLDAACTPRNCERRKKGFQPQVWAEGGLIGNASFQDLGHVMGKTNQMPLFLYCSLQLAYRVWKLLFVAVVSNLSSHRSPWAHFPRTPTFVTWLFLFVNPFQQVGLIISVTPLGFVCLCVYLCLIAVAWNYGHMFCVSQLRIRTCCFRTIGLELPCQICWFRTSISSAQCHTLRCMTLISDCCAPERFTRFISGLTLRIFHLRWFRFKSVYLLTVVSQSSSQSPHFKGVVSNLSVSAWCFSAFTS